MRARKPIDINHPWKGPTFKRRLLIEQMKDLTIEPGIGLIDNDFDHIDINDILDIKNIKIDD